MAVMDIHGKIEALRHRKGWTQQALADLMGVTHKAVFAWEHTATPRKTKLHKLADLFDVSPTVLMDDSEPLPEWVPPSKVAGVYGADYADYLKELKAVTEDLSSEDFTENQRRLFMKFFSELVSLKSDITDIRSHIAKLER